MVVSSCSASTLARALRVDPLEAVLVQRLCCIRTRVFSEHSPWMEGERKGNRQPVYFCKQCLRMCLHMGKCIL